MRWHEVDSWLGMGALTIAQLLSLLLFGGVWARADATQLLPLAPRLTGELATAMTAMPFAKRTRSTGGSFFPTTLGCSKTC